MLYEQGCISFKLFCNIQNRRNIFKKKCNAKRHIKRDKLSVKIFESISMLFF